MGLVPESIGPGEFQDFINILQTHIYATDAYRGERYSGDVLIVEAEDTLPGRIRLPESGLGWRRLTSGCLTVLPTVRRSYLNDERTAHFPHSRTAQKSMAITHSPSAVSNAERRFYDVSEEKTWPSPVVNRLTISGIARCASDHHHTGRYV